MGNYRGTTRCSSCYQTGHNKAGCPTLKARVEKARAEDPDSYLVRREDAAAARRKARATGKRVCAYCQTHRKIIDSWDWRNMEESDRNDSGCVEASAKDRWGDMASAGVERDTLYGTDGERGVGHSIRACKYRKADIADRTSEVRTARINHLERMISNGIGPGASITFSEDCNAYSQHPTPGTFVVTGIDWSQLGINDASQIRNGQSPDNLYMNVTPMRAVHVAHLFNPNPPYGMSEAVTLPLNTLEADANRYRSRYTAAAASLHRRTSEEKVRNSIPFGWTDGTDEATQTLILDALMSDVKSRSKKKK